MRAIHAALKIRIRRFAVDGKPLDPQQEGVPMDEKNDPQRKKRILDCAGDKSTIRQLTTLTRQLRDQHPVFTVPIINVNLQMLVGQT